MGNTPAEPMDVDADEGDNDDECEQVYTNSSPLAASTADRPPVIRHIPIVLLDADDDQTPANPAPDVIDLVNECPTQSDTVVESSVVDLLESDSPIVTVDLDESATSNDCVVQPTLDGPIIELDDDDDDDVIDSR